MTQEAKSYTWSTRYFSECYKSLRLNGEIDVGMISNIKLDLFTILQVPSRNDISKNSLLDETKPLIFSNGESYKLNRQFIEAALELSSELELDELVASEVLFEAQDLEYEKGTNFLDSGRLAFFSRYDYILNILIYLASRHKLNLIFENDLDSFFDSVMNSFKKLYALLSTINELIDKQKLTDGINNLQFVNIVGYLKKQILRNHELLGELLFIMVDNGIESFLKVKYYKKIISFLVTTLDSRDALMIHYLPSLLKFLQSLNSLPAQEVMELHADITSALKENYELVLENEMINSSKSKIKPVQLALYMIFLTHFIAWCKSDPSRTSKYDFKSDIITHIEICISCGATDVLLSIAAETSDKNTISLLENNDLYNFRALVQVNFPNLVFEKFIYVNSQDLRNLIDVKPKSFNNARKLLENNFEISTHFNSALVAPFLHSFFQAFISNGALILSQLRDSEEDFLLASINRSKIENTEPSKIKGYESLNGGEESLQNSSLENVDESEHGIDLDQMATRADLERLYLTFVYVYTNREDLCRLFWEINGSTEDILGFISWGLSNNTSPLITATFCLLLGSLTSGGDKCAISVWELLQGNWAENTSQSNRKRDFSKISVDSIIESLKYYVKSLNKNYENDVSEIIKVNQRRQELLFTSSLTNLDKSDENNSLTNQVMIELSEDSCVFISGFIQLISFIAKNLSSENEKSREIKRILFHQFLPLLKSFLSFDNLIVSNSNSYGLLDSESNQKVKGIPKVFVKDENRVTIVNLILNLFSSFACKNSDLGLRYKIWETIDAWIFQNIEDDIKGSKLIEGGEELGLISHYDDSKHHTLKAMRETSKSYLTRKIRSNFIEGFLISLSHLSIVSNFVELINNLLTPISSELNYAFTKYKLLFPANLGDSNRPNHKVGIWPYIEYLLTEAFAKSSLISSTPIKFNLVYNIIEIVENSIEEIDWKFLLEELPQIFPNVNSLDQIFGSFTQNEKMDYIKFVRLHQSISVIYYLYDEKIFNILFKIIDDGAQGSENIITNSLLGKVLKIIKNLLNLQDVYVQRFLPILKDEYGNSREYINKLESSHNYGSLSTSINDNVYHPKIMGTNRAYDFYEIFLFHLTSVANLALLVGSEDLSIARDSLSILNSVSCSNYFVSKVQVSSIDPLLNRNRMLTIFESIDESIRIQYVFIDQFERFIDNQESLGIKIGMLNFISENLSENITEPGISHFLLGYEIRGGRLSLNKGTERKTLLSSLLLTLFSSLNLISEIDYDNGNIQGIDLTATTLCTLILQIFMKLAKNPISSLETLNFLRSNHLVDVSLFEKLIKVQPKVDPRTQWHGYQFDGDMICDKSNAFVEENIGAVTLISYIQLRNLVLQYLSVEFHAVSQSASVLRREGYIDLLLDDSAFLEGMPKILNFLDVLNFGFYNFELHRYEKFAGKYSLSLILEKVKKDSKFYEGVLDFSILQKNYKFACRNVTDLLKTDDDRIISSNEIMIEGSEITQFLTKYIISSETKTVQLMSLHSWTHLMQILVSDANMSNIRKSNLILEIIQVILPKINDYMESDVSFSEELISLCVVLFDLFAEDNEEIKNENSRNALNIERLLPLFKACLNGIMSANSTSTLRSDLYVLCTKFLQKSFQSSSLLETLMSLLTSMHTKFIDVICNDSVSAEGPSRITSLLLLESLMNLSGKENTNFLIECMSKNNALSLIVRSLKRSDEMISLYSNSDSQKADLSFDTLLYELTAFKTTLYLLLRISQNRVGASQLIQNEIFSIIKQCKFLSIDPDLGLNLKILEPNDNNYSFGIALSLDTPITLTKQNNISSREDQLSYFEFLVPTFQLITAVLLAMGPSYKPSKIQAKELVKHFERLIVGILKRDVLLESEQLNVEQYSAGSLSHEGLSELINLITLLDSLAN